MDFFWPSDLIPSKQEWRLLDSSGVFTASLTGTTRTVSRPGGRIACVMTFESLSTTERHRIMGLLAALRGRANRIWLSDFGTQKRGSFPANEELGNTTFAGNTTGWSSSNAELVLTADSGRMRLSRTGVVADRYASASIVSVSGSQYLIRAGVVQGRAAPSFALQLGTTSTGAELVAGAQTTTQGLAHATAAATGVTTYGVIRDYSATRAADYFQLIDSPSIARCALVQGASQTGSGFCKGRG